MLASRKILNLTFFMTVGIFFLGLSFLVGIKYSDQKSQNQIRKIVDAGRKSENDLKEELDYCISNLAKIGEESSMEYNFQDFGIYSPLFEEQEVTVVPYWYKKNTIFRKTINGKELFKEHSWGIVAWSFEQSNNQSTTLTYQDFPIFSGYENRGFPVWVSDIKSDWKKKKSFKSTAGIEMYWTLLGSNFKSSGPALSTTVEFLLIYTPSGKPTFYKLWVASDYSKCGSPTEGDNPCYLKEEKLVEEIEQEIANTIKTRKDNDSLEMKKEASASTEPFSDLEVISDEQLINSLNDLAVPYVDERRALLRVDRDSCDWHGKILPYRWYWEKDVIVSGISFFVGSNKKDSCPADVGQGYPSEINSMYFIKQEGVWKFVRQGDSELCTALKNASYRDGQGGPRCTN